MRYRAILSRVGLLGVLGCGGEGPTTTAPSPSVDRADLEVTLSGTSTAGAGEAVSYTVTASNGGTLTAAAIEIRLELPATLTAVSAMDNGVVSGDGVTWSGLGDLAPGESRSLAVDALAPAVGPITAKASGTTTSVDAQPSNNDGRFPTANQRTIISFDPVATIQGESSGDQFGWLIEAVGDVDRDGTPDFAVTANGAVGGSGRVYVYSGASRAELFRFTGQAGENLGTGVDAAGDVNGDGVPDLLLGAPAQGAGRVYVVSGATGTEIYSIAGETAGDRFGASVGRLGDTNGDGVDDFVVGATGHDDSIANSGRVYIISGSDGSILATHNSLVGNSMFGASVGGVGDLNGDNIPDFGVGAPGSPEGGRVYVLSGRDGELIYASIVQTGVGGSRLGDFWLNTPGDVNDDGTPDLFTSDILHSSAGSQAGRAYVFSGADGTVLRSIDGESAGDNFGIGRGVADANQDGVGDLILAAWLSGEGGAAAGKAYLYSGSDGTLLRTLTSTTPGENLGFDVIGIGDVTADGIPDYLISGGISPTSSGHVHVVAGVR